MLRIDTNVEETQAQVELGHTELLKYFQVGQSNSFETILEIFKSKKGQILLGHITHPLHYWSTIIYVSHSFNFRALHQTDG